MLCLSVGCGVQLMALAQRTYTLDECVQEALANNALVKNAENSLSAARYAREQAFTNYFPSLSASGGGFMANKGTLPMSLGPGMEMSLMKNGVVGGVSAALPLFTGGQIVNGNRLAKVGVEVSKLQKRQSENEVVLTAENYYWKVVVMKEKLRTIAAIEEQLASLLKDVQASVDAGLTTRNDLLRVRLQQNEMKSSRVEVENGLRHFRRALAQYIGHPGDSVDVAFAVGDTLPLRPDALYAAPEASLRQTSEYGLLQENLRASRLRYNVSLGKNLPTIAIGGGYMYHNLMDRDHSFWMGFATVSVPLSGWWGGSRDMKKQKMEVRTAENNLVNQSELLTLRMLRSWDEVNDAYKQVEIALESIGQAKENLRLNTDYYAAGTSTMSDLLDAQALYRQSRDKYVESLAQYEVKKREYLQATGR